MSKQELFFRLLDWRKETAFPKGATPSMLSESLSCEGLVYEDMPSRFSATVTAFRHLRQDARLSVVRAWLGRPESTRKKPRKRLRKTKPVFAVCGYQVKKCASVKEARAWCEDRLGRCSYPSAFIVKGEVTVLEKVTEWPLKRTILK